MAISTDRITERLHQKIDSLSTERKRRLLAFLESFEDDTAQDLENADPRESLRQALHEAEKGDTHPVENLWERVGL